MLDVKPFSGIRYDQTRTRGDISAHIAPPYDVLDQTDKDALLGSSADNIVAIDLPHIPPKSAGPQDVYGRSATRLDEWLQRGTMIREPKPALYVYHQRFQHEQRPHTRRMFIARTRLEPLSSGAILPHEQTFSGPKADRLALMKATRCQLSPIFGLYTDPHDRIGSAFGDITDRPPDVTATMDGVENRMWIVTDRAVIDAVSTAMAEKRIFIADGHHRYGTAVMYRDWLRERAGGALPDDHPANHVMFVLASMDDPGCLILPYHRALADVDIAALCDAWAPGTSPAPTTDAADIVLYDGRTERRAALVFTNRSVLSDLEPGRCAAWYDLDYAYLHRYLIDELLRNRSPEAPAVHYLKSADDARLAARDLNGVALLVNATPMAQLRAVSEAGELMPQKSTYFFPKLATGLVIHPLA